MNKALVICIVLLFFLLPICSFAENSNDPPLELLQQPKTGKQTPTNQLISSKNEELRDIRGPVTIAEQPPYLLIFTILGFLLILCALLFWFLRKKRNAILPPIPPWERALMELAEAKNLLSPQKGLLYMDRASQILRGYIESRFAIRSTRQTTGEFLKGLTSAEENSPLQIYKTELGRCLEQADMAKFAHQLPNLDNLIQMEVAVTTFIEKTEPVESKSKSSKAKGPEKPYHGPSAAQTPLQRGRS